jgi:hypothetical protein
MNKVQEFYEINDSAWEVKQKWIMSICSIKKLVGKYAFSWYYYSS